MLSPIPTPAKLVKLWKKNTDLSPGVAMRKKLSYFRGSPVTPQSGASSTKVEAHLWYFHRGPHCNVCVTACYIIVNVRDLPLSSKLEILQNRSKNQNYLELWQTLSHPKGKLYNELSATA